MLSGRNLVGRNLEGTTLAASHTGYGRSAEYRGAGFRRTTPEEPLPTMASSRIPAEHLRQYSDLAMAWMQEYLRIDTTNPPGHEMQAVSFYKKILDQEGIENRAFEYTPGRCDLWARLPHTTAQ